MSQSMQKPQKKDYLKPDSFPKLSKDNGSPRVETQAKYKTEFCRNLEAGFCEYGDKCFFAHTREELRDKTHLFQIKTIKCKSFFEFGYCLNGNKCQYSHRDVSPVTAENSPNASNKASRKGSEERHKAIYFIDLESRNLF